MSSLRLALKQSLQETATTTATGSVRNNGVATAGSSSSSRPLEDDGEYSSENEYASDDNAGGGGGGGGAHAAAASLKAEAQGTTPTHHHHPTAAKGRSHSGSSTSSSSKKARQQQPSGGGSSSHRDHSAANTIQAKWKHKQSQSQSQQPRGGDAGEAAGKKPSSSAAAFASSSSSSSHHQHQHRNQHSPKPNPNHPASTAWEHGSSHSAAASIGASHAPAAAASAAAAGGAASEPPQPSSASKKKKRKNKTVPPPSPALVHYLASMPPKQCRRHVAPGLRVKVRFATNVRNKDGKSVTKKKWFGGRVSAVSNLGSKIRIRYDDGTSEVTRFPDPDVIVDDSDNGEHAAPYDVFALVPPQHEDGDEPEDDDHVEGEFEVEENENQGGDDDVEPDRGGDEGRGNPPAAKVDSPPPKPSKADGGGVVVAAAPSGSKRKRGRPPKQHEHNIDEDGHGDKTGANDSTAAETVVAAAAAAGERSHPEASAPEEGPSEAGRPPPPQDPAASSTPTSDDPKQGASSRPSSPSQDAAGNADLQGASANDRGDSSETANDSTAMEVDDGTTAVPSSAHTTAVDEDENREPSVPSAAAQGQQEHLPPTRVPTVSAEDGTAADRASSSPGINVAPISHDDEGGGDEDPIRLAPVESEHGVEGAGSSAVIDSGTASARPAVAKAPSFTIRISAAKAMKAVASEEDFQHSAIQPQEPTATKQATGHINEPSSLASEAHRADDLGTTEALALSTRPQLDDSDSRRARSSPAEEKDAGIVKDTGAAEANAAPAAASGNDEAQPKEKPSSKRLHIMIPKASLRDEGSHDAALELDAAADENVTSQPLDEMAAASRSPRPKKNKRKHPKEEGGGNQADGTAVKRKKLEEGAALPSSKSPVSRKRVLEVDATADDIPFVPTADEVGDGATTPHARNSKDLSFVRSFRLAAHKANERISSRPDAPASDVPKKKRRKLPEGEDDGAAEPDGPATGPAVPEPELGDAQVQCDACTKWRLIPAIVVPTLPQQWYCSDNVWDPKRASCEAPEQTEKEAAKERKRRKRLHQRLAAAQRAEEEGEALAAATATASSTSVEAPGVPSEVSAMRTEADQVAVDDKSLTSSSHHQPPKVSKREESVSMASTASDDATAADKKRGRGRPRRAAVPAAPSAPKESTTTHTATAPAAPQGAATQPGQGQGDDGDNLEWVQCDSCSKWRKLPPHVSADDLPEVWYCSLNTWNPSSASCDAPEDKADGLQDVGFHSGSGAGKLSYRNLIFGNTGRKANRPLSERARAAESLFLAPNDDEDAPPAVMYANSSCFVSRGRPPALDENSGGGAGSLFDRLSRSNLFSELWGVGSPNSALENRWMYYTYDTLPGDAQEAAKDLVLSVMGDELVSSDEILRRATESSSNKVRKYFTINVVVTCLFALVKQGLVDCVQKMGPDFTVQDWDPRYRRRTAKTGRGEEEEPGSPSNASVATASSRRTTTSSSAMAAHNKSSRCIKIAKPWKRRAD